MNESIGPGNSYDVIWGFCGDDSDCLSTGPVPPRSPGQEARPGISLTRSYLYRVCVTCGDDSECLSLGPVPPRSPVHEVRPAWL